MTLWWLMTQQQEGEVIVNVRIVLFCKGLALIDLTADAPYFMAPYIKASVSFDIDGLHGR